MPIEIRELVIRAHLGPELQAPPGEGRVSALDREGERPPIDVELIVQECVRQVLRVLARQQER